MYSNNEQEFHFHKVYKTNKKKITLKIWNIEIYKEKEIIKIENAKLKIWDWENEKQILNIL